MERQLHEVRVRVQIGEGLYQKKSKFYNIAKPSAARKIYKGSGHIMTVEKVSKEKLLGIGDYFTLGDTLLREFNLEKKEGGDARNEIMGREVEKSKIIKRRQYAKQKRETSY